MKTYAELKKAWMEAYKWALKVQKASLFKPWSVEVSSNYTEVNDRCGSLDGWTVEVYIHYDMSKPDGERGFIHASWAPWRPEDFESKEAVEKFLADRGVTLK